MTYMLRICIYLISHRFCCSLKRIHPQAEGPWETTGNAIIMFCMTPISWIISFHDFSLQGLRICRLQQQHYGKKQLLIGCETLHCCRTLLLLVVFTFIIKTKFLILRHPGPRNSVLIHKTLRKTVSSTPSCESKRTKSPARSSRKK